MRRSLAFSLIELLVVITIIVILVGLIVGVGAGWIRERARILVTSNRINQVQVGLAQYSTGADLAELLQRIDGFDRRLGNLQAVLNELIDKCKLDLSGLDASKVAAVRGTYPAPASGVKFLYPTNGNLPPGLGVRWENALAKENASGSLSSSGTLLSRSASRKYWPSPGTSIKEVITFMDRQIGRDFSASLGNTPTSHFPNIASFNILPGNYWMMVAWDDVTARDYPGPYNSRLISMCGGMLARKGTDSPRGESLDRTREIMPQGQIRTPRWYMDQWPNLREQTSFNGAGTVVFRQSAWPASDWDQATPGTVPVVWHWPWGKQIFSRIQGSAISQLDYELDGTEIKSRTLADLSPLSTIRLLQAAGILPEGTAGADAYRTDRGSNKSWNDSWGSPIIAVSASFMPARYDFDDEFDLMKHGESGAMIVKDSGALLGGRDLFITKSEEMYQFSRAFYVAAGSLGMAYTEELSGTWAAANDAVNLRKLWLRLRTDAKASTWKSDSFVDPPWSGVNNVKVGTNRVFLAAPVEYR